MKTRDMACLLLYVLVLVFICVSCTKTDAQPVPAGEQELPDMEMRNATYTLARGSGEPLVMQAATITIHRGNRGTVLEGVTRGQSTALLLVMIVLPVALMVLTYVLYQKHYKLDEPMYDQICAELKARREGREA